MLGGVYEPLLSTVEHWETNWHEYHMQVTHDIHLNIPGRKLWGISVNNCANSASFLECARSVELKPPGFSRRRSKNGCVFKILAISTRQNHMVCRKGQLFKENARMMDVNAARQQMTEMRWQRHCKTHIVRSYLTTKKIQRSEFCKSSIGCNVYTTNPAHPSNTESNYFPWYKTLCNDILELFLRAAGGRAIKQAHAHHEAPSGLWRVNPVADKSQVHGRRMEPNSYIFTSPSWTYVLLLVVATNTTSRWYFSEEKSKLAKVLWYFCARW